MQDSYGNGPAIVAVAALLAAAGAVYGLINNNNNNNVAPGPVAMAGATPSPEPEMPPMGDSNNNTSA
jgi:hypothetical protein